MKHELDSRECEKKAKLLIWGPSQKFAEACETKNVRLGGRGSRPFSQSNLQKKKKKKIELHVEYVRCAPLGTASGNRLELDRAG